MTFRAIGNNKGFTLIEILVAITIVGLVLGISLNTFNNSNDIEEAVNNVERSIRYSIDEAALRNVIIRTRFNLDGEPQTYTVEYGPDDSFVIPLSEVEEQDTSVLRAEENAKKKKDFNKNFNRIPEFSDGPKEVKDTIRIIAVGSSLTGLLYLDGQASLYTYPTGEKDGGIVVIGNDQEVVAVTFEPFLLGFKNLRQLINPELEFEEVNDEQDRIAKEMFENWLKK